MKEAIHPAEYRPVVFHDASADFWFVTRSTVKTHATTVWKDGKTYPLYNLDISSASHPFFTGKQKFVDTAGRVERFQKKFAWTGGKAGPAEEKAATPAAASAAAAAAEKGKGKGIEATSLKQFAARSKHVPAPVPVPPRDAKAANVRDEAAEAPAAEAKAEKPAAAAEAKPEAPRAEKKPKGEKKERAPRAEKAKPQETPKDEEAPKA
jgi:large subunit ribosomal protein L31